MAEATLPASDDPGETPASILIDDRPMQTLNKELYRYRWPLALALIYALTIPLLIWALPAPAHNMALDKIGITVFGTAISACLSLTVVATIALIWRGRRALWSDMRSTQASVRTLILLVSYPVLATAFVGWKAAFSAVPPWNLDATFTAMDAWIHGGTAPHEWITPWLTHPIPFMAGGVIYNIIWPVIICLGAPAYIVVAGRDRDRAAQYLLAFFGCWILLGSIMAPLTYAVGPAFVDHVTSLSLFPDLYRAIQQAGDAAPTMTFLSVTLEAVNDAHQPGEMVEEGTLAMAAMPSLHIAVTTLIVCYAWAYAWRWRLLALAALLAMSVLAVGTGWHYALDIYAAIPAAVGIWWAAGKLT